MNDFFIGDTHFGHKNIIQFEKEARPFSSINEHDNALIDNWNRVVGPKDRVFHLGDVALNKRALDIVKGLNGKKILIMGNHDVYGISRYVELFDDVVGLRKFDDCILSHAPMHASQKYRFKANIHGHVHSNSLPDPWYVNVSAENVGLTPLSYDELRARMELVKDTRPLVSLYKDEKEVDLLLEVRIDRLSVGAVFEVMKIVSQAGTTDREALLKDLFGSAGVLILDNWGQTSRWVVN